MINLTDGYVQVLYNSTYTHKLKRYYTLYIVTREYCYEMQELFYL